MTASAKRIRDIVGNQHRGAYDRAALLTGACVEALKITSRQNALEFFNKIKDEFPRHSAFQAELKRLQLSWLVDAKMHSSYNLPTNDALKGVRYDNNKS